MSEKFKKLSKPDRDWLDEGDNEKWSYVLGYIERNWHKFIPDLKLPNTYLYTKKHKVEECFLYLKNSGHIKEDIQTTIRKTKEAWRVYKTKKVRSKTHGWLTIRIRKREKVRLEKLAKEIGATKLHEVLSTIINEEYKHIYQDKLRQKEERKVEKQEKQKSILPMYLDEKKLREKTEKLNEFQDELQAVNNDVVLLLNKLLGVHEKKETIDFLLRQVQSESMKSTLLNFKD